ncbi:hypothetical protein TBLA_0A10540 [Henningerozyma blattae CBS 6284]|uniref:Major facilitator superfamily (MFS) profile domain-containing protein n=1 Tax=Henningerozyma blattae (strain ATCC 34711 / CBS 6284 / DSM 70876 / NBRC 10599 / NRRL Y-10934 / UCD 77-7) TaxID=1071380 RepID=I2GXI0_HENB6|nr:hypothetical protein TBLA_0A10540 [Tetrapisispora blattae CBS 6284]CCH58832.1 hypothetical protein TBLA_0A10540 [Tetrapisispora blattae CBS 6284]
MNGVEMSNDSVIWDIHSGRKNLTSIKSIELKSSIFHIHKNQLEDKHDIIDKVSTIKDKTDTLFICKEEKNSFPEGGLRGWLAVFASFIGMVASYGTMYAPGVIENYIKENQLNDTSSFEIGWIFSLYIFICFITFILGGTLFDNFGFKKPILIGTIIHVGSLFSLANCRELWQFILGYSILGGFGNGILIPCLISIPSQYFNRKRALAISIASIGGSIGGIIIPILLRKFFSMHRLNQLDYGFIWGIRTWAFLDLVLLLLALMSGQSRIIKENVKDSNIPSWKYYCKILLIDGFDYKGLKDVRYVFCVIATIFTEVSLKAAVTYLGSYCTSKDISNSNAYLIITIVSITGIPGRYITGYLADKFGRYNITILYTLFLTLLMLVDWFPFGTNLTNLYVIISIYGFLSSGAYTMLPVCCGQVTTTDKFAVRYSTMYFIIGFVQLGTIPGTGAIIGWGEKTHYQYYVLFCGLCSFLSLVFFIIARYCSVKFKLVKF